MPEGIKVPENLCHLNYKKFLKNQILEQLYEYIYLIYIVTKEVICGAE